MNCSRFRFLIQQWFDAPLSAQDERMLTAHIESCDSCARFQHQLDQVVQGTPDVALPDECLPSNLEALAKRIMDQIPQEKPGFFGMLKNLFGGIGGGSPKKTAAPAKAGKSGKDKDRDRDSGKDKGKGKVAQGGKAQKGKAKPVPVPVSELEVPDNDDSLAGGSQFPHVRRRAEADSKGGKKPVAAADEELLATSTRLKNLQQKLQPVQDEPQAQSQGMSLGGRFGMNVPMRDGSQQEDAPLTLAESIRRKMVEDKAQADAQSVSGGQNFSQQPAFGQPQGNFGQQQPANFAQQQQQQQQQQFSQPSGFSAEQAASQFAPPAGFTPQNFAQPGGGFGQQPAPSGGFPPASGFGQQQPPQQQQQQPPQQQSQPLVGQWGEAATAPPPQASNWAADPPRPGVGGDSDWKPAPPTANAGTNNDWQMGKPQPGTGWAAGGAAWGAQPQQPPTAPGSGSGQGWSGEAQPSANPGWQQQQAQQQSPGQASGWGEQPAAQQTQAANGNWTQPPAAGNFSDPQATSGSHNWGQQSPVQQQNWDQQQSNSGGQNWGQPGNSTGWSEQAGQPQAPAQQQPQQQWAPQQAPQQQNWAGAPAQDGNWSQQPQPAAAAPATQDGWAAAAGGGNNGAWNQGPVQQSGWGQSAGSPQLPESGVPVQSGWGVTGGQPAFQPSPQAQGQPPANVNPFLTAAPAPAAPVPPQSDFETWSEEGEQIQTGMWQAFNLDQPEIGQPRAQQAAGRQSGLPLAKPQGTAGDASRFDTPIQQRTNEEGAALAAAAAGKGDPSMFDIPIQERLKMQQQQGATAQVEQPAAESRWDMPIQQRVGQPEPTAAAVPVAQGAPSAPMAPVTPMNSGAAGQNKSSIMDRLNKVLGDDCAAAMAAANPPQTAQWATAPSAAAAPAAPSFSAPAAPSVPPINQPAPVAPQPVAAPAQAQASGLFKLDDKAIDKVFKENLGVNDQNLPVGGAPAPSMAPPVAAPMAAAPSPAAPALMPPVPPMNAQPQVNAPPPQPAVAPAPQPAVSPIGGPRISAVPPRQAEVAAAPAQPDNQGLLRHIDDQAINQIFANNLGLKDVQAQAAAAQQVQSPPAQTPAPPVPPMNAQPMPAVPPVQAIPAQAPAAPQPGWNTAPAPAPAQPPATARGGGLLSVDDDAMDRIFSDLGVKEKAQAAGGPKINVREAVNQIRSAADMPAPPKVEGIGRLTREEVVSEPTPGKINAIGKFLLDQQDLSKIGQLTEEDLSDTKVRVLTHEASEEINRLLAHIATQPGVVGSVIVGHDGILIASSLPKELDPETIGILSLGIYINTTNTTKKMAHNHLHQLVCRTPHGYLVIADFGGGILITVSNEIQTEKLIPLMRSITQLVAQS